MEVKNVELNKWKDQHCNVKNIEVVDWVCHDRAHPEVTFGNGCRCDGCPYRE